MGTSRQADEDEAEPPATAFTLGRPSGEFCDRGVEAAFRRDGAIENFRHARVLLIASVILNTLFLASDWRFHGTAQFWIAIPARALVIASAVLALALIRQSPSARDRERVMIGWMLATGIGVTALVSSHSDLAMFVVIMLPIIYHLAVPVSFAWRVGGGASCSMAMLAGYERGHATDATLGLFLAMLVLNVAMALVVARSNRLERLEWQATRTERRTSAELAASREQFAKMFAASPVPMIVTSFEDGRLVRLNDSAVEFIGGIHRTAGLKRVSDLYVDPDDRNRILAELGRGGRVRNFEMTLQLADTTRRTVLVNASMLEGSDERMVISGIIDISDRKANEQGLEWLASTDALTGLANRLSFFTGGRAEMMRAARLGAPLGLMMIDLDHFKQINDSFGHQGGDEALRRFAATCRAVIGDHGIAGRLGGEEFGILLPNCDLAAALATAERLRDAVERMSIEVSRGTILLTASIGVAAVDPRDRDLDPAIARADAALYAAKNGGRNRVMAEAGTPARRAS